MQGRLSVLLQVRVLPSVLNVVRLLIRSVSWQSGDVWDRDVLQDFISGIAKQIYFIVEE